VLQLNHDCFTFHLIYIKKFSGNYCKIYQNIKYNVINYLGNYVQCGNILWNKLKEYTIWNENEI